MSDAGMLVERLEALRGQSLTDEEKFEIELWQKGRKLLGIVGTDGWETAVATLQMYAVRAMDQLMAIPPGDERVTAAHAVAYGANEVYVKFLQDIASAVDAGRKAPAVVQEGFKQVTAVPPESM